LTLKSNRFQLLHLDLILTFNDLQELVGRQVMKRLGLITSRPVNFQRFHLGRLADADILT
jgi:hypothetical protein